MAKFVNVTFGSDQNHPDVGQRRYTYIVNDNVRTGDTLYVAAIHYKSNKVFGTTSTVRSTTKETTAKGQELKKSLEAGMRPDNDGGERQQPEGQKKPNKYILEATTGGAAGRTIASDGGRYVAGKTNARMEYLRGKNIEMAQETTGKGVSQGTETQRAVETYSQYTSTKGGQIQKRDNSQTYDEYTRS